MAKTLAERFSADDPGLRAVPWDAYRRFRQECPVARLPAMRSFAVFSAEGVHRVLSGREFTVEHHFRASRRAVGPTILDVEDPLHRMLRHVMHPPLGLSSIRSGAAELRALVDELLDELPAAGDGPVDLMARVAEVLPMRTLCRLLGLPAHTAAGLARAIRPLADYLDEVDAPVVPARECRAEIVELLDEHFFAAGSNDSPLGGALLRAYRAGRLTLEQTRANLVMLAVVGTVTTVCGSGNTLTVLLAEPQRYAAVVAGGIPIDAAVAESLRLAPPVHFVPRFCQADTTVLDVPIPAGATVQVCIASANHDEDVFPDAGRWLPERANLQRAFSFGYGRHGCVGGLQGEAEITTLVRAFADRFPVMRLHGAAPVPSGWVFRRPPVLSVDLFGRQP